jgi:tRNA wybutosine-synthesizing protein 3
MPQNNFEQRKQSILSKIDKSSRGHCDERIMGLCRKINSLEDCYTTSSCSGRVVLMIDQDKKLRNSFIKIYHDLINFEGLKKDLDFILKDKKLKNGSIKYKQEPCILHIACKSLSDSEKILRKVQLAGWKRSGIIASGKRFIVESISTEKLEFPIIEKARILANDEFLRVIVKKTNENLKKTWNKIEKLEESIN